MIVKVCFVSEKIFLIYLYLSRKENEALGIMLTEFLLRYFCSFFVKRGVTDDLKRLRTLKKLRRFVNKIILNPNILLCVNGMRFSVF